MGLVEDDPLRWRQAWNDVGLHLPHLQLVDLWQARGELLRWMGVIVPMGLFNVLGSMQNVESAAAAGDDYPLRDSLVINGVGTMVAAVLGSCFPTTIYIGHPSWKALGARLGYSWINGLAVGLSGHRDHGPEFSGHPRQSRPGRGVGDHGRIGQLGRLSPQSGCKSRRRRRRSTLRLGNGQGRDQSR